MIPLIPLAKVEIQGGWFGDDTHERARITMNGTPVNAVLYSFLGGEYRYVDRITEGKVDEDPSGTILVTGLSEELLTTVGVAPAEAIVTWRITPHGCAACR